jgi:type I restriction enzyme M protein
MASRRIDCFLIRSVADLLRGEFKPSPYGRIILPFRLLRRLECVLEAMPDRNPIEYS